MTLPADVATFTGMLARLLRETDLCGGAAVLPDPEVLRLVPQDYLMDSLVVMRRVGLDPEETACLSAVYLGLNPALIATNGVTGETSVGLCDALAKAGRSRLATGRLEPLFLLFETALGEQMALRRQSMN